MSSRSGSPGDRSGVVRPMPAIRLTRRSASALIPRLCGMEALDLDAVLRRIGSAREAAAGRCRMASGMADRDVPAHPPSGRAAFPLLPGVHSGFAFQARHLGCGVVVREWPDPSGPLGFRVVHGRLEMEVGLGAAFLSTDGPWATLHLHARLPETLILVIPGRPLASLVDHPMFRDAGYRVEAAWQPPMRGGAVIRFRPGLIR